MSRNNTIWKFPLEITDYQDVMIPHGIILSVAEQGGQLCLWAMVDPVGEQRKHRIRIVGTGNPVPQGEAENAGLIGTVLMSNGLVWHVFELWTAGA